MENIIETCQIDGHRVKLFKIENDGERCVIAGMFDLRSIPEKGQVGWCGSLRDAWFRTSLIQEVLENDNTTFRFRTLNSVYEARRVL